AHSLPAWVDTVDDEAGESARGVELAGVAGALQVAQNLLVNAAECVTIARVVKVDFADLVDDLAHQRARLHVVVSIFEHTADHTGALARGTVSNQLLLKGREQLIIDESAESLSGHAFRVCRPVAPTQVLR